MLPQKTIFYKNKTTITKTEYHENNMGSNQNKRP